MIINALEPTQEGGSILINVTKSQGEIFWEVWKKTCIPDPIKKLDKFPISIDL